MGIKQFIRASVDELWQRANTLTKIGSDEVYINGSNNQYPKEIELAINNSPSATLGATTKEKFLIGQGFNIDNDKIVNSKLGLSLYQVGRAVSRTLSRQGGFFIHVAYGINERGLFVPNYLHNLNYSKCRVAKKDDIGYEGAIYYSDWGKSGAFDFKKKSAKWFYPFDNNQDIIKAQLKKDAGITHNNALTEDEIKLMIQRQRGQVLFVNSTPEYTYPLAPIDSAYNDADTEYRISIYANNSARHGFQKKKIIATNNLDTDENNSVNESLRAMLGVDGTAAYVHLELENIDNIDSYIKVIELDADFDDKQFEITQQRVRKNILGCFGVPEALVSTTDINVFGNSGESYKQMKAFYNQQTEDDRQLVRDAFANILNNPELQIIPLEDVINEEDAIITE